MHWDALGMILVMPSGCIGDAIEGAYGMHRGYFWDALEMHWECIGGCIGGCFKDVLGVH